MKFFILFVALLSLSSCGLLRAFKLRDAMEAEKMVSHSFKKEMPFQIVHGFIVVEMSVGGKTGNFILDTGMGLTLSDEFSKSISFKTIGKQRQKDVSGKVRFIKMVKIDNVSVGGVDFQSIVASVGNFPVFKILKIQGCMDNISGILGANVMNKGIWQIDYLNKIITITDSRDSIKLPADKKVISFSARGKGTPEIPLYTNGVYIGTAYLDTGNSGDFVIPKKTTAKLPFLKTFIKKHGFSTGAFGTSEDTSLITQLRNLRFGQNFETVNTWVSFSSSFNGSPLIGYNFLKDYLVTIDWKYQELTLLQVKASKPHETFDSYGFTPKMTVGKLRITSIIERSPADLAGFKLNDQILQINDMDFRKITQNDYCDFLKKEILQKNEPLILTIQRGDLVLKHELKKADLMELLAD